MIQYSIQQHRQSLQANQGDDEDHHTREKMESGDFFLRITHGELLSEHRRRAYQQEDAHHVRDDGEGQRVKEQDPLAQDRFLPVPRIERTHHH